jgi:phospholipase C
MDAIRGSGQWEAAMAVEHIVIIVKENHTYDNYFGTFPGGAGERLAPAQNPPPTDPRHDHLTWMRRAADGRFHVQYSERDIPDYFNYARNYVLCDNYFSEVAGPSTPNHLMLICADAPIINNPAHHYRPRPGDGYNLRSLPAQLERAGLEWGNYGGYAFHYISELAGHPGNHTRDLFQHHAMAGQLPAVSWVYGDGRPDLTEHPRQNVTDGMGWTAEQVNAIVGGGLWPRTAIFITWDDWGGWYDHVEPAVVETWDSAQAQRAADAFPEFDGQPFRYGSRVPCLVLSPYAKSGHLSHQLNSHVSLVRFCQENFGLPPLNRRDAGSNGMSDCFDFAQPPLPPPRL